MTLRRHARVHRDQALGFGSRSVGQADLMECLGMFEWVFILPHISNFFISNEVRGKRPQACRDRERLSDNIPCFSTAFFKNDHQQIAS